MDTEIYSEAVINRFLKKNLFFNDQILEKYYEDGNLSAFRKRVSRLHKQSSFEKMVYAYVTDTIRDVIFKTIGELSEFTKSMGDLIISGGEAFNMYLDRNDRLIASDIDTKFIPRVKYNDKYFGKLQAIKLILWNKLGETAKKINMKVKQRLSRPNKIARFIGLGFSETGPYVTRRYTLIKKKKSGSGSEVTPSDVFIDVELFALDLNVRYFSIEKGAITQEVLGGILDMPFMRPGEFGYEVIQSKKQGITYKNKDTNAMVHDKRVFIAGKRFLLDDVYLMQKLGLRPEKKEKDRQRLYKLSKLITKDNSIQPTDSINTIYERTYNKVKSHRVLPRREGRVRMSLASKINPKSYSEYTTKPVTERLSKQIVYGVKASLPSINIPGFAKTYGTSRFDLNKQKWIRNKSNAYVHNEYNFRPLVGKQLPKNINTAKVLYGYKATRDKWVSPQLLRKASEIPFVGLKN